MRLDGWLRQMPPEPTVDRETARRVADEVLSRPEYADAEPGLAQRVLDRVLEAVAAAFDTAAGTAAGRAAGIVVLVVLGVLLAWLLFRSAARLRWDRAGSADVGEPFGRSPEDWIAEAEARERDGDLRGALRCHYRALLAWLAEQGYVEEVPGSTSGEYRAAVTRALPEAAEPFAAVTAAFDRAWYGQRPVERPHLEAAIAAAERVRERASQPSGAAA